MATLNATLISDDEYRKSAPAKAHRSSISGPATTAKSSSVNRTKETVPSRGTGGYVIPTQSKEASKRSSSQKVSAPVSQSINFSSTGYQQRSIEGQTKNYS
jgi:hypothetical protein